jgi:hypothetical protein
MGSAILTAQNLQTFSREDNDNYTLAACFDPPRTLLLDPDISIPSILLFTQYEQKP